jgi:hypothetical protein
MAWDKDKPAGSDDAGAIDTFVQTNNAAIEAALGLEHYFVTGGVQTGRHKIPFGTLAQRAALANIVDQMIFLCSDKIAGKVVLQFINPSGGWQDVTVYDATLFRTNAKNPATVPQYANWVNVPIVANAIAVDFDASPCKYSTLTQNVTLSNPINDALAGTAGTNIYFDIIQNGTGGWTMNFGNNYRTANGLPPLIAAAANARTRLYISSTQDSKYLITTAPDVKVIS